MEDVETEITLLQSEMLTKRCWEGNNILLVMLPHPQAPLYMQSEIIASDSIIITSRMEGSLEKRLVVMWVATGYGKGMENPILYTINTLLYTINGVD